MTEDFTPFTNKQNTTKEKSPSVGIMLDIETLDTGPRSVIMQLAAVPFDFDEEEILHNKVFTIHLPIQPQLDLLRPRTISASTLAFWMEQSDTAKDIFSRCDIPDFESLRDGVSAFVYQFSRMIKNVEYEVWARGPQFDITNIESLLVDLGFTAPWKYDKVRDLRTFMSAAGVTTKNVLRPESLPVHDAYSDCVYQIQCLFEAKRLLRAS